MLCMHDPNLVFVVWYDERIIYEIGETLMNIITHNPLSYIFNVDVHVDFLYYIRQYDLTG